MTSATRTREQKAATAQESSPRYARKGDLGPVENGWEDIEWRGLMLRVRYLSTAEVIQISYLPDLTGLVQHMSEEFKASGRKTRATKPLGEFLAEQTEIKQRVAHVAIADPDKADTPEKCEYCTKDVGGHEIRHRPALFSPTECGGLTGAELETIEAVALKRQGTAFLRPFSEAKPAESSEPSVSSGDSTQAESS